MSFTLELYTGNTILRTINSPSLPEVGSKVYDEAATTVYTVVGVTLEIPVSEAASDVVWKIDLGT